MASSDRKLLAPAIEEIKRDWGEPITAKEMACIYAGYKIAMERVLPIIEEEMLPEPPRENWTPGLPR